jgi:hypothetical protein
VAVLGQMVQLLVHPAATAAVVNDQVEFEASELPFTSLIPVVSVAA